MNSAARLIFCCPLVLGILCCRTAPPAAPTAAPVTKLTPPAEFDAKVPSVPMITLLADPSLFAGREVAVEGFLEHSEGGFILSPDLRSLAESLLPNLIYVDTLHCRHKGALPARGQRAYCQLRARVIDDKGERSGRPCYKCTLSAQHYIKMKLPIVAAAYCLAGAAVGSERRQPINTQGPSLFEDNFVMARAESRYLNTNYVTELLWSDLKLRPWDGDSPLPLSAGRAVQCARNYLERKFGQSTTVPGMEPWQPVQMLLRRKGMLDYWYYEISLAPLIGGSYNWPKVTIFVTLSSDVPPLNVVPAANPGNASNRDKPKDRRY
jgi:hypothetical protein